MRVFTTSASGSPKEHRKSLLEKITGQNYGKSGVVSHNFVPHFQSDCRSPEPVASSGREEGRGTAGTNLSAARKSHVPRSGVVSQVIVAHPSPSLPPPAPAPKAVGTAAASGGITYFSPPARQARSQPAEVVTGGAEDRRVEGSTGNCACCEVASTPR